MTVSTRTRLENAPYPILLTQWTLDEDGLGWNGEGTIWKDANIRAEDKKHTISIRQGNPLGSIFVSVDDVDYGAWAFNHLEGTGITERDLMWAGLYAVEAIKRRYEMARAV